MKKIAGKPKFNVLYDKFNGNKIVFMNWFEFGQWSTIKKELTSLIKKMKKFEKLYAHNIGFDEIQPELREFFKKELWAVEFKKCKNLDDLIRYAVEERLNRLCMYYFWCKCEYEVIVSSWPPRDDTDTKIDIYTQLRENWEIFRDIVFREINLAEERKK